MPRPITPNDMKRWKQLAAWEYHRHPKLGWWISKYYQSEYRTVYSYSVDRHGHPLWVTSFKTIQKRMKLGHPPKRKSKKLMKDISIFTMDEIELATKIMEEMNG